MAVAAHDHFDHIGGLHAFDERWCHEADAGGIREPDGLALRREDFRPGLEDEIRWYDYELPFDRDELTSLIDEQLEQRA